MYILHIIIGSRFLSDPSLALEQITVDAVLNFPKSVNAKRSPDKMYSVDEAYDIIRSCSSSKQLELTLVLHCTHPKAMPVHMNEFSMTVSDYID